MKIKAYVGPPSAIISRRRNHRESPAAKTRDLPIGGDCLPEIFRATTFPWIDILTLFGRITGPQYGWFGW
jgi:hypothetical protein